MNKANIDKLMSYYNNEDYLVYHRDWDDDHITINSDSAGIIYVCIDNWGHYLGTLSEIETDDLIVTDLNGGVVDDWNGNKQVWVVKFYCMYYEEGVYDVTGVYTTLARAKASIPTKPLTELVTRPL